MCIKEIVGVPRWLSALKMWQMSAWKAVKFALYPTGLDAVKIFWEVCWIVSFIFHCYRIIKLNKHRYVNVFTVKQWQNDMSSEKNASLVTFIRLSLIRGGNSAGWKNTTNTTKHALNLIKTWVLSVKSIIYTQKKGNK